MPLASRGTVPAPERREPSSATVSHAICATSIVHASERAQNPRRRRVLQVDYASEALPGGLQWLGVTGEM